MEKVIIIRSLLLALVLGVSSGALSFASAESHISIRIVKPGDRRNIPTGESHITVEISGTEISQGYRWELYADQLLAATIRDGSTSATVNFRRTGPHRIQVVLFDHQGNRVSNHEILVTAAPVESRKPIFNREQFASAMAGLVVVISSMLGFGLWYGRRARNRVYFENEQANESADAQNEAARVESV